ncbi:MAG: hypothetical protein OXI87_12920 [Albidovulum sp.]|nr:hypothetical protein [Albidovulum sp.]MDE0530027.1 hypothetical protein [Albidovulum sp.]
MKARISQDLVLGIVVLAIGLFVVFVWAPIDSDTGIAEKVRGRWAIGDALAPSVAGALLAVSGAGLVAGAWLRPAPPSLGLANFGFVAAFVALLAIGLSIMRYSGPGVAELTANDYRPLRDEIPWKYIGFVSGGSFLVFSLVYLVERRFDARRVALSIAIALILALAYDLPFEDLLLPPNADV